MNRFASPALITAALLMSASLSIATENKPNAPTKASGNTTAKTKITPPIQRETSAKIKLVDINSASAEQLKKLPGIGTDEAAKIIAGRPYGSKAWLVTNHIIGDSVYEDLKQLIIAKQPYEDAGKNAAIYEKKK